MEFILSLDQSHTVDLNALRTTFISWLGLYGVDPRAQQALSRQAGSGVMLKNYQDFRLFDLSSELK
ncbi:MAG: hypothetical protein ACE5E5_08715 [Phycisphaerae bacterium]